MVVHKFTVDLNKHIVFQSTASESSLFDHLINIWEFIPGPVPRTCSLYFLVDFKFQSPLYWQVHYLLKHRYLYTFVDNSGFGTLIPNYTGNDL
ncbi:hypothetical protein J1N35_044773 [Gossypium stocksii]|uniref:Uncharacterized protein n=1 Tax=Gossypium stocksii TaxID=47602 RepID=A0A9D3ZG09_9ROSI|nr:hypothetical protein J1N35_044773 [Gossypium stocksii]